MKKAILVLITVLAFISVNKAQETKIDGRWLVEKIEVGDKVHEPFFILNFEKDGTIVTREVNVGSWKHNSNTNQLIMKSEMDKDFRGECRIITLNKNQLVFEKKDQKWSFSKLNMDEIMQQNVESGFIGTWEIPNEMNPDILRWITFDLPNQYTIIEKGSSMETKNSGEWMFKKSENVLYMFGRVELIGGKSNLFKINESEIKLENKGSIMTLKKANKSSNRIERLSFTEADFFTENGDYKYDGEEGKLPWSDPMEMMMSFINTRQLEYNFSSLVEDTEVFETKQLLADVNANKENPSLSVDYIFYGYDRYNLPEDTALPPNNLDMSYGNQFFPLKENSFRVVGEEEITIPPGTYQCTIVESTGTSEERYKLWMINEKPGVYARIIEDKEGAFGHYHVYELKSIIINN